MAGLRRFFHGTGPYSGMAAAAFLLGLAMLFAVLLSPNGWQWWLDAHQVQGHESDGVVTYSYQAQNWTVDDSRSPTRSGPRTAYVIANAPYAGALVNTPTVILDWATVGGSGLLGAGLLALGFIRRSGMRRRQLEVEQGGFSPHGYAIPTSVIRGIVAERERDDRRRTGRPN